jgi:hypothetical protein
MGLPFKLSYWTAYQIPLTEGREKQKNKQNKYINKEDGWEKSEEKMKYAAKYYLVDMIWNWNLKTLLRLKFA